MVLDVFAGQKTAPVLNAFRESQTVTLSIPESCVELVQTLDIVVNKIFKDKIHDLINTEFDKNPDSWITGMLFVLDHRVLIPWVVGEVWDWLQAVKSLLIMKSFC